MTRPPARSSCRKGSVGFRWGEKGKWNLEEKASGDQRHQAAAVAGRHQGRRRRRSASRISATASTIISRAPTIPTCSSATCRPRRCSSPTARRVVAIGVRSVRRQLRRRPRLRRREHRARATTICEPYTPAWAEKISGVPRDQIITVAREFALNAEKTSGRSMVILGAGAEPLVPHGHELPRHHQHAGDVRLRRAVRRRLVALCRPGKAAAAVRLDAAGVRPRLGPSAAADELDVARSTPTPTSGVTRRSTSARSCRRPRRPVRGTAR